MPSQPRKSAPPALELPPRPPSKVEQGLAEAAPPPPAPVEEIEHAADQRGQRSADELRVKAIEAMVAAGLPRAYAEASFELSAGFDAATAAEAAAEVADLAAEAQAEDFGAPFPTCGCHRWSGWKGVPAHLDGIGCEHGSWPRKPKGKTDK